jgi:aspartyl-tRNA(Asn)/glutamyl-tRNA(Gln) amidotransferase subunit A
MRLKMRLNQLTVIEALKGLKEKKFSALELTQACLDRIKAVDDKIKAFLTLCPQQALTQAKKADKEISQDKDIFTKKPLLGIPFAVKDNFCTKGIRTTAASKVLENYIPVYDATVVKRLKEAGAVILGKTNMDAWAHGSSTETSDFFTTHNPWDLTRLPGGSSGGNAAAVVADEVIAAIGSETAGSIRQPAAWCGITGFKPTYGRVSRYGVIAMASSTDSPGPMTKTAADAVLVLQVLAGQDEMDATTAKKKKALYKIDKIDWKKLKIGVPKEYFLKDMDKEITKIVKEQIDLLGNKGAKIMPVSLLEPKYSVAVYTIVQRSEVSSNLARYDGLRYGHPRSAFGTEAKRRIMLGTYALSAGYYDQYYLKAQKVRTLINQDFDKVFHQVDLLAAPTTPVAALKLGAWGENPMFGEIMDILVEASSLAGLPGVSLPCGFTKNNLPVGMQLIGPQFSEELLLKVGHKYQEMTDWHRRKPTVC